MVVKIIVEGSRQEVNECEYGNLCDAMDDIRTFLDFGYVVSVVINGCYFRMLRDSGIVRSIPIGQGP